MTENENAATPARPGLDAGTYEVLRARLGARAEDLARRAEELNTRRQEVFGGTERRLAGTERVRTEHKCVPRDIAPVGGLMLFGFNVFMGLEPTTSVGDVFALHRLTRDGDGVGFEAAGGPPGLLRHPGFERDFAELYRYYRDTRLLQLRRTKGRLLAVLQTGPVAEHDTRVLRWSLTPEPVEYWTTRATRTTCSSPRTTSNESRRPATTTFPAAIRTSPSPERSSSRRSAAT